MKGIDTMNEVVITVEKFTADKANEIATAVINTHVNAVMQKIVPVIWEEAKKGSYSLRNYNYPLPPVCGSMVMQQVKVKLKELGFEAYASTDSKVITFEVSWR